MRHEFEHFQVALSRMKVSNVWRRTGSALFLEFGVLAPTTKRDGSAGPGQGELGLMIEWSWRIEKGSSILCGSWSDESLWQPTFSSLIDLPVTGVSTFGRLPEISVSFEGDLHVASFMTAEGDPAWSLFDRRPQTRSTIHSRHGV